ncbi:UDP-N-acetylglucosamine 2-epimerase (non-hydrolyzing) [Xylanibacillus composti]|uniref:UDP-N-acetyl glucosamine 2-epimerase n=1 Tax=Xylanibacillus composti TaxID=1572762 RepID=A0A8J4M148_9BACL|nr:UDP-N-acetylglucosamine 2-epimerase (non-hydrolyzing) [Xylanibacillus composti]MDT9723473.1 UDP-N-acetylglucosamine 2-epimerase (non-hydrolyzing) [Xylanibacillus composti]GIQ68490.1 UDP-N-acetyl glucosamine 2-epimerase [Xylanibacillus composti]
MKAAAIVGARPQFVKAGMLSRALRRHMEEIIIHTGQHYDANMSAVFFEQLSLPHPEYELQAGSDTHARQTARMLMELEEILVKEKPDFVLVFGDTNSTLAGSLAAAKLHIPIAHVEAGLRSYNRRMPEEINRVVTDHLSTVLFCPTGTAVGNLKKEGITRHTYMVGDVMCDAVLAYKDVALRQSSVLERLGLVPGSYYLATIHRAENTDNPEHMRAILRALHQLDRPVLVPLHPRTKKCLEKFGLLPLLDGEKLHVMEPLRYLDMLACISQASVVLTDSGGVQKEAYMLHIPCVTMRSETEWVETVAHGGNVLAGADSQRIVAAVEQFKQPVSFRNLFGDGKTADQIAEILMTISPDL